MGHPGNFNGFRVLAALLHGTLAVGVTQTAALNRGRHLDSAGRPSRWALAHISSVSRCISHCAKLTRNTCLILRSDKLECQGQKSKVKVTRDKKRAVHSQHPPRYGRNGTPSLQRTPRKQTRPLYCCSAEGCLRGMRALGLAGYRWALPRISRCTLMH